MKQLFASIGLVCLVAMLPACAPAPEPEPEAAPEPVFDQEAEEEAIRKVVEKRIATFNQHDAKTHAAQLDQNWENWDGTVKGRAGQEKSRTEWFERQKDIQLSLSDEIGIVFVTPDVAIYKYQIGITGSLDADGKPLPPGKRLLARVFVKKEGKWLIAASFGRPVEE